MTETNQVSFDPPHIVWHWAPAVIDQQDLLDTLANPAGIQLVKHNQCRTVYLIRDGESRLYLKQNHPQTFRDRLKTLGRCKARKEFKASQTVANANVSTAETLGWGTNGTESFILSREIEDALTLPEAWRICRESENLRTAFMRELAGFLGSLLESKIVHPDLHHENILVQTADTEEIKFFLIDVYGAKTKTTLRTKDEMRILQIPHYIWKDLSVTETVSFYNKLFQHARYPNLCMNYRQLIEAKYGEINTKWRRRTWRFLKTSCYCEQTSTHEGHWLLLKPMSPDLAARALELHRENIASERNIVKADRKRLLSRVRIDGQNFLVKEYRHMRFRGRWRSDRMAWLNHQHLAALDITVCRCHAWLKSSTPGAGYLLLEDLGRTTARNYLNKTKDDFHGRHKILKAAASIMGWLHLAGVDHCDLTLVNFMLTETRETSGQPLALIDVDRVHFYKRATPVKRRLRNIDQLLELLAPCASPFEGIRLLGQYRRIAGRDKLESRTALKKIKQHWN